MLFSPTPAYAASPTDPNDPLSNPGAGFQALQRRQMLANALRNMGQNSPAVTPWQHLANAGMEVGGAMLNRNLQNQGLQQMQAMRNAATPLPQSQLGGGTGTPLQNMNNPMQAAIGSTPMLHMGTPAYGVQPFGLGGQQQPNPTNGARLTMQSMGY